MCIRARAAHPPFLRPIRYSYGHNSAVPVFSDVTVYTGIQQNCPASQPSSRWTYTANDSEPDRSLLASVNLHQALTLTFHLRSEMDQLRRFQDAPYAAPSLKHREASVLRRRLPGPNQRSALETQLDFTTPSRSLSFADLMLLPSPACLDCSAAT